MDPARHQIRRMPVIDEQGHLIGIIALADLARVADAGTVPSRDIVATLAAVSAPREIIVSAA